MNFIAIKSRFSGRPKSIKEKTKLRKIKRKTINATSTLETEIKNVERLKIEMIECKISKSLKDLNIDKGIEIGEIKETVIKLEKLKIPKAITKLVTPEKYLQQISRHNKCCA